MYWRLRGRDFQLTSAKANRRSLRASAEGERPPGLVALDSEGRAVGWVAVAPRKDYERTELSRLIPRIDDRPAWSVVCFVVSRRARGQGIAKALLDAAVGYAAAAGAPALEAYPVAPVHARIRSNAAYTGTLSMFAAAGFEKVADTQSVTGGAPRVVVRRDLAPPTGNAGTGVGSDPLGNGSGECLP
ncbi:MAG TPA: GNAT family N-acetyltransferase [Actinobacteria bacterium]|nr:GNAT family N-acetyltransferase [Actinomycetota bacterium]